MNILNMIRDPHETHSEFLIPRPTHEQFLLLIQLGYERRRQQRKRELEARIFSREQLRAATLEDIMRILISADTQLPQNLDAAAYLALLNDAARVRYDVDPTFRALAIAITQYCGELVDAAMEVGRK